MGSLGKRLAASLRKLVGLEYDSSLIYSDTFRFPSPACVLCVVVFFCFVCLLYVHVAGHSMCVCVSFNASVCVCVCVFVCVSMSPLVLFVVSLFSPVRGGCLPTAQFVWECGCEYVCVCMYTSFHELPFPPSYPHALFSSFRHVI